MNDGLDTALVLAGLDEKPSKQYRTSPYTVRQYTALPYAERRAVDAACDAQAGLVYSQYNDETSEKPYTVGRATKKVKGAQPAPFKSAPQAQLKMNVETPTHQFKSELVDTITLISQPSSPMSAYVHPAPSPALHYLNTPELIEHDETHPDNEHTSALPAVDQKADLLSASAESIVVGHYDIVTVAGHYVSLTHSDESTEWTHWGYSPFLGGDTHSFAVNESTGQYKCFTSLRSGGAVDLVMFMEEISQQEAENWLATTFPEPMATNSDTVSEVSDSTPAPSPEAPVAIESAVYMTTNYDLFHLLPQNRAVNQSHVRVLVTQISERNLLHTQPLDVTADMGIIDGQHRLAAARELGVPVYYKIGEELSETDITALNVARKNWAGTDYLHFYTVKGKPDYMALTAFMERHPMLSFSNAKMMLGENQKGSIEDFRRGKWKAGQAYKAEQVAEFIERIAAEVKSFKQPTHTGFVAAVHHCVTSVEGFDTKEFMHKIQLNPRMLVPCASLKQFLQMFEEVYNFRTSNEKRVRFL